MKSSAVIGSILGVSALSGLLAGCSGEAARTPVPAATSSAVTSTPSPEAEPPKAKFSRTMYATSTLKASTPLIDDCRGPVAIQLRGDRPVLVAEHDYCGGDEWIPRLAVGDAVELGGEGLTAGTYVVTTIERAPRGTTRVSELPDADAVLQTCISTTELVLVAVERLTPDSTASARA